MRKSQKGPIVISRNGKPQAVVISYEQYEKFLAAVEELEDIETADLVAKSKDPTVPWEKVKKELGLSKWLIQSKFRYT